MASGGYSLVVRRLLIVVVSLVLVKDMITHSNILAGRIPWTEEPGRLYIVHGVAKSWT